MVPEINYDPTIHRRRSIRLQGYDYSQTGAYFVTVCTHNRQCLFGGIVNREMRLNDAGQVVQQCWDNIPTHFPHVELDEFVVMPNHVHGIVMIMDIGHVVGSDVGATAGAMVRAKNFSPLQPSIPLHPQSPLPKTAPRPCGTSKTLGSIVRGFKIGVTKWMRNHTVIRDVWQRNYWEHIVRNEQELNRIREYMRNNPAQWETDRLYPSCKGDGVGGGVDDGKGEKFFAPTVCESSSEYKKEVWMV